MRLISSRLGWSGASLVIAMLMLTGCLREQMPESQVIARVNQDEISIHQLNFALSRQLTRNESLPAQDELVEKLINRQISVQQALQNKLDRRPDVMLRIEEARRDILAAAYAEEVVGKLPPVNNELLARYYAEHPGLFAERKVYRLREMVIPLDSPALATSVEMVNAGRSFDSVLAMLRDQRSQLTEQRVVRPSEQLPIDVVDRLHRLGKGASLSVRLARGLVMYEVIDYESAPMSWERAQPIIKAHLDRDRGSEQMRQVLAQLRSTAQVERGALAKQGR